MTAQRDDDALDVDFERLDEPGTALTIRTARPHLAVVDFDAERETARRYAEKSLAESTRIAYAADFAAWSAWCAARRYPVLPGDPLALATYLPELHEQPSRRRVIWGLSGGMRANAINRRLAAIAYFHTQAGLVSPAAHPQVKNVLRGILREKATAGETVRRVAPILADDIRKLFDSIGTTTMRELRDRALLLLCFRGALRRSELAALGRDLRARHAACARS